MEQTIIQTLTSVVIWLWPLFKPGVNAISTQIGRGLGSDFLKCIEKLRKDIRPEDREQAEKVDQSPTNFKAAIVREISEVAKRDQKFIAELDRDVKISLQRLLRNDTIMTYDDLSEILVANLGYRPETLVGRGASHLLLANKLVDQAIGDNKCDQLIQEIQTLKPHLFEVSPAA